jgi:hypothetical protein
LKRDVRDYARPNQRDQQRSEGQACEYLLFPVQQHSQLVDSDHDRGAHGGHHGAGEGGVEQDGDERKKSCDFKQVPTQGQILAARATETNQRENYQSQHGHVQTRNRQHVIYAGGGESAARLFADLAHVADHQGLEQRPIGTRKIFLDMAANLAPYIFYGPTPGSRFSRQQFDFIVTVEKTSYIDAAPRQVTRVVETTRIAAVTRHYGLDVETHSVAVAPFAPHSPHREDQVAGDFLRSCGVPNALRRNDPATTVRQLLGLVQQRAFEVKSFVPMDRRTQMVVRKIGFEQLSVSNKSYTEGKRAQQQHHGEAPCFCRPTEKQRGDEQQCRAGPKRKDERRQCLAEQEKHRGRYQPHRGMMHQQSDALACEGRRRHARSVTQSAPRFESL